MVSKFKDNIKRIIIDLIVVTVVGVLLRIAYNYYIYVYRLPEWDLVL